MPDVADEFPELEDLFESAKDKKPEQIEAERRGSFFEAEFPRSAEALKTGPGNDK